VNREDVRAITHRSGRSPHLLEREAVTEKAREVFEQIRPDEPPKPPVPPDDDGGGGGDPRRQPEQFSSAALMVGTICAIGGAYLLFIGFRGVALELRRLKGGK
jgi:hypothetical protein